MIVSVVGLFLPYNSSFQFFLAIGSAILFSAYIVFDTQQILKRLSPEEYILASVELYLDLLNLFLAILRILDNRD
jgi:FtsH-binding integral membrane protein